MSSVVEEYGISSELPSEQGSSSKSSMDNDAIKSAPKTGIQSPYLSEKSAIASTTGFAHSSEPRYFHSRRVKKGEVEKPWLSKKDPMEKWVKILPIIGLTLGCVICFVLVWDGLQTVTNHTYCTIYDDDFSNGLDTTIWQKEVEVGGYGNGQFEWTTGTDENVYVQDGTLFIKPTLQNDSYVETDQVINLLGNGCTGDTWSQCITGTNSTNGTIIQPVKSGRINTKSSKFIKYGKVEVTAKLPTGDWLWPAIWLLPVDNVYGAWPRSGEIDIVESRGNNYTYAQGGNNVVSSTLHWGPDSYNDGYYLTNYKRQALHTTYGEGFHTFGLEWSEKYLYTFIDSRLLQIGYTKFSRSFWSRGDFPSANSSGAQLTNPWVATGLDQTPFDQDFYLILNVAVGGTNGWFADGASGKPWVDDDPKAKSEFWDARDQWYPTWEKSGNMQIKRVVMMQQTGYNGCTA